jgi:hypothetical protein
VGVGSTHRSIIPKRKRPLSELYRVAGAEIFALFISGQLVAGTETNPIEFLVGTKRLGMEMSASIHVPDCDRCQTPMNLVTTIRPLGNEHGMHLFECASCHAVSCEAVSPTAERPALRYQWA